MKVHKKYYFEFRRGNGYTKIMNLIHQANLEPETKLIMAINAMAIIDYVEDITSPDFEKYEKKFYTDDILDIEKFFESDLCIFQRENLEIILNKKLKERGIETDEAQNKKALAAISKRS